jgi:flagellar basal-body rod modification protein FlgD
MTASITNYVANQPSATNTVSSNSALDPLSAGQTNLNTSYQTFLTLLTSQLKNQDPTSPLDPNQFTQQLVQMTGVQQQLLSNQLLQQLVSQGGSGVASAVGLIGKTVTADSPTAQLTGGKATWSYDMSQQAVQARMTITDSTGALVWSGSAPDLSAGIHPFTWDGKDSSGAAVAPGTYTLSISAVDANGAAVTATPSVVGTVTSISQANGQTMLEVGGSQVPLSSISAVTTTS